jgi:hypothetical protein
MIILPGFEEFVSQEDLNVFDNGRYEEIVQMLSDLGYLSISADEGKILDPGELKTGVVAFRNEAIRGSLIRESNLFLPFPEVPEKDHNGILTYREFSLLQMLVALDGDFTLKPLVETKGLGLYTRVIQYRLHLLGLLKRHPDGVYRDEIDEAIARLAGWLSPIGAEELLALTGNIGRLVLRLKESPSFVDKIVYFNSKLEAFSKYYSIDGSDNRFIQQLGKDIDKKSQDYRQVIKMARPGGFDRQYVDAQCNDAYGDFIIRLSQISQWISGYYLGKIDGELGRFTFESFRQLGQAEVEHGNSDFDMGRLVGHLSDDYWVVNPHYLFREITVGEAEPPIHISDVFSLYNTNYELLTGQEKDTVDENLKIAWKSINVDQSDNMKSSADRFCRIYFGARSLLRSFWKGLKNIFNQLKETLMDITSGLFSMVKNFAKFLYREIRESLQIFSRGVMFLFGNREFGSPDCISKFDFDMDSVTWFSGMLTPNLILDHQQKLTAATTGLAFCLTLTGRIIRLAITAFIGWPQLILEAGSMLKQLVKECFSEKEFAGFSVSPQG